jgi:uncharacterized protein (TIGR03435 family)
VGPNSDTACRGVWLFFLFARTLALKGTGVDPSSVIAAIRADLGLKLESEKRPVDVLVVDHVEKLTVN